MTDRKLHRAAAMLVAMAAATAAVPAQAQIVNLTGTVINLCVLTISTPGILAVTSNGLELSTLQSGGVAASLAIVATGSNPTVTFTAPTLSGPSSAGSTTEVAYSSSGGASRAMGTGAYVYAMNRLLDTITINGRASNSGGFRSGIYTIASTATCSQ